MTKEKTWLLGTLGVILVAITAIVIWQRGDLLAPWWVLAVIAVPWIALGVVLRIKVDTWGFEGKYVDWWSIPHFVAGVLFALAGIGLGFVVAIATVWEIVEVYAHTKEHPQNRVVDVLLAAAGWALANALAAGPFALY